MLVTVARYSFPYEAQIARARLQAQGIEAYVADEHTINMQWLYSDALGGVKVQVVVEDLEQARSILAEDLSCELEAGLELPDPPSPCCQGCGSPHLEPYGHKTSLFLVLLSWRIGWSAPHSLRCRDCGAVEPYLPPR
ncbi:DUF2007 domain-containing protein [Aestuariirhabdus litorea]|uniref:DUF2007 domain-containing protein n=1 Tax=Aestuariirhabdus litorea TaxID=2528527 RepID=A0A3P3VQA7_9GAMM|nr:DUF2007 domain-containing protein [Aestuariirhabdus litorea]RRJ83003.1 DUF2007 domain-containing protein [Aestuariirhabdus litorea]RWW93162.1 DUF2007 domain-containing protein [Endozoicomonadaceae bacterium GTF-13]